MKIVAISDIHGCYNELMRLLELVEIYVPGHKRFVFLGDYIDRGPDSKKVVEFMMKDYPSEDKIVLLGNHDEFMINPEQFLSWRRNGGQETLNSYGGEIPEDHLRFIRSLPVYYTHDNWLFVHAGIDPNLKLEDQSYHDMIWSRRNNNATNYLDGWKVVHGHTAVKGAPFIQGDQFFIDTACCFGYKLTAMIIDTETDEYEFLQVDKK